VRVEEILSEIDVNQMADPGPSQEQEALDAQVNLVTARRDEVVAGFQVLAAVGCELVEMPRNRDNSFCCGAGGGRIWMEELKAGDGPRPSESRIDEATSLPNVRYFVVCCPKDVTMYEDAIKTSGHQGEIELRELSELVLESLDVPTRTPS